MAKEVMTVEEVAHYLRVKPSTVYEWAKDGKIPAAKVGRLWQFKKESIDRWVTRIEGGGRGSRMTKKPVRRGSRQAGC